MRREMYILYTHTHTTHAYTHETCVASKSNCSHLNIGESSARMVTETANHVAGVAVIIRMATERRIQAQFATLVGCADVLVNRVHGLEYTTGEFLKFAQLHWLLHAMVLQIVHALRRLKGARAGDRQPIHIRKFTLLGSIDVIGGSETKNRVSIENLSNRTIAICNLLSG